MIRLLVSYRRLTYCLLLCIAQSIFAVSVSSSVSFTLKKFKMASNTQGIQQLLAAEKKAADKVGEARKRK